MWIMFWIEALARWKRAGQAILCVILAIYITCKGQAFPGPSMMPPIMCSLTALTLGLTALAIGFGSEETD
jgi:hypothetical protein